jgi:hypothetical protein
MGRAKTLVIKYKLDGELKEEATLEERRKADVTIGY